MLILSKTISWAESLDESTYCITGITGERGQPQGVYVNDYLTKCGSVYVFTYLNWQRLTAGSDTWWTLSDYKNRAEVTF